MKIISFATGWLWGAYPIAEDRRPQLHAIQSPARLMQIVFIVDGAFPARPCGSHPQCQRARPLDTVRFRRIPTMGPTTLQLVLDTQFSWKYFLTHESEKNRHSAADFLLGPMRAIITFIMFLALAACGATNTQSDADISKALIGTWIDAPSEQEPMHGRVTYFADGHSVEIMWPVGQSESNAIRIETQWTVTNSILILASVKSSNTQMVPIGVVIKDRVISISTDQFVFEPAEGYGDIEKKRHVRIRQQTGA